MAEAPLLPDDFIFLFHGCDFEGLSVVIRAGGAKSEPAAFIYHVRNLKLAVCHGHLCGVEWSHA